MPGHLKEGTIVPDGKYQVQKIKQTGDFRAYLVGRNSYFLLKRTIDLIISSVFIILVLSWLTPLLALAIKMDSPGPVFFRQRRAGFLGKSFFCFKFRTMVVNPESDRLQAVNNDPRITRLGRFLRMTSLDELPQFLNVFLGDMSIVGPRPHMHSDNEAFARVVDNYRLRSLLKPGITGMAQVKGMRGPATDFYKIFHRYQWDAFYIRNANLALDFKIIRLTAVQMLRSIFAYKSKGRPNEMQTAPLVFAKTVPANS